MSGRRKSSGDRGRRLAGLMAAAGLVAVGGWYGLSAGRPAAVPANAPAPVASAGQVIYRDPATGRLGVPPPDVAAQLAPRVVQRPAAPRERLGITPRGGVALDHPPRMAVTATAGGDGTVAIRCDPAASGQE